MTTALALEYWISVYSNVSNAKGVPGFAMHALLYHGAHLACMPEPKSVSPLCMCTEASRLEHVLTAPTLKFWTSVHK